MKYAAPLCTLFLAAFVLGACAFDQSGYTDDGQVDPGSDMGIPDPADVNPGAPDDPGPGDPGPGDMCSDEDGDGFFAEAGCGAAPDCHDDDEDAHPGQDEFFEDAIAGDDYDYNCDGIDEKELDVKADPGRCESGWKKNPPRCGDEKDYITCEADDDDDGSGPGGGGPGGGGDDCECTESKVVQRCR